TTLFRPPLPPFPLSPEPPARFARRASAATHRRHRLDDTKAPADAARIDENKRKTRAPILDRGAGLSSRQRRFQRLDATGPAPASPRDQERAPAIRQPGVYSLATSSATTSEDQYSRSAEILRPSKSSTAISFMRLRTCCARSSNSASHSATAVGASWSR